MKKSIFSIIGVLFLASFMFVACEETEGVADPYTDWEARNQAYIDSIAEVAKNNPSEWKIFPSYKLPTSFDVALMDVNEKIYCKVLEKGDGNITPLFTDVVSVNYRGKLIPLYDGSEYIFDQNYLGELNPDVAVPSKMVLYGVVDGYLTELIVGWQTALMQMKKGDRWEIYIPSDLGYGEAGSAGIPGNSTLIFDVRLDNIYPLE